MKQATIDIEGISSFLYSRFNIETLTDLKAAKEGTTGNNPLEWKQRLYTEGKKLYVPSIYLHSSISAGGKHIKVGRGNFTNYVRSALFIEDEKIFFNIQLPKELDSLTNDDLGHDSSQPLYIDIRAVVNPMTKGKNVRYRPALCPGWKLSFRIRWDDSIASKDQIKRCVENAGALVGIGDARTLGHGRFKVTNFSVGDK